MEGGRWKVAQSGIMLSLCSESAADGGRDTVQCFTLFPGVERIVNF